MSNSNQKATYNRYYVDATKLSPDERDKLYYQLDTRCESVQIDINHIGCYVVLLDTRYSLEKWIDYSASCTITRC